MTIVEKKRVERHMTQKELEEKSGVKQSIISDIESGKTRDPRVKTIQALADVLEFDWTDFYRAKEA